MPQHSHEQDGRYDPKTVEEILAKTEQTDIEESSIPEDHAIALEAAKWHRGEREETFLQLKLEEEYHYGKRDILEQIIKHTDFELSGDLKTFIDERYKKVIEELEIVQKNILSFSTSTITEVSA